MIHISASLAAFPSDTGPADCHSDCDADQRSHLSPSGPRFPPSSRSAVRLLVANETYAPSGLDGGGCCGPITNPVPPGSLVPGHYCPLPYCCPHHSAISILLLLPSTLFFCSLTVNQRAVHMQRHVQISHRCCQANFLSGEVYVQGPDDCIHMYAGRSYVVFPTRPMLGPGAAAAAAAGQLEVARVAGNH